jgi:hypothetical protein
MSREAMQMALEALEILTDGYDGTEVGVEIEAITALRQALDTEQEPVAWMHNFIEGNVITHIPADIDRHPERWTPLYTAPPKQWQGMTDQEVWEAIDDVLEGGGWLDVARVLEQAFKEKNT